LRRIAKAMEEQRGMVYANVVAPGPEPVEKSVSWGHRITPPENRLLMQAYHQVNYDVLSQLPEPESSDGIRSLPKSWAFLFSNLSDKEHIASADLMTDRSLASIVAVVVLQAIRDQTMRQEQEVKTALKRKKGSR